MRFKVWVNTKSFISTRLEIQGTVRFANSRLNLSPYGTARLHAFNHRLDDYILTMNIADFDKKPWRLGFLYRAYSATGFYYSIPRFYFISIYIYIYIYIYIIVSIACKSIFKHFISFPHFVVASYFTSLDVL